MDPDIERYLAYSELIIDQINKCSKWEIVPYSYYWTVMMHEASFPCRCGVPGHQFPVSLLQHGKNQVFTLSTELYLHNE
jgi:hypothetical protein